LPCPKKFRIAVAEIVSANEESIDPSGDRINTRLELVAPEVHAIFENASLGMVSSLHKANVFPDWENPTAFLLKSVQVGLGNDGGTLITQNQFLQSAPTITCHDGE